MYDCIKLLDVCDKILLVIFLRDDRYYFQKGKENARTIKMQKLKANHSRVTSLQQLMFLTVPAARDSGQSSQSACISEASRSLFSQITHSTYKHSSSSLLTESKEQLKNLRSIQNGFYVANLYTRFQYVDRALFVLVMVNAVSIAVYTELQMSMVRPMYHTQSATIITDQVQIQRMHQLSQFLLWSNLILTCITIPVSFFRHSLQKDYQKIQKKQSDPTNQLWELLFILIQPYPFCDTVYIHLPLEQSNTYPPIEIKLNLLLVIASILKSLLIVRYLFWHDLCRYFDVKSQKFFKPSYNRICKIYSCDNNYIHIMKCLFRQNFIVFIGGFYFICMATCAYCLRIVQSHFDGRFLNILNCMWFTLLSMTTVGYGDLYVTTPIGIGLDGLLMFSGVVIVSLLVSSLNGLFTLGYRQKRALTLLKRLKDKSQLKEMASIFIAHCLSRQWLQKKTGRKIPVSQEERVSCRMFNQLRMTLKCGKQKQLNLYRDMLNQFESLKLQLEELMGTCEDDIITLSEKQRLTLNRDSRRDGMRNRSSSYCNLIRMKSRDSRLSILNKNFKNHDSKEKATLEVKEHINAADEISSENDSFLGDKPNQNTSKMVTVEDLDI